MKRKIEFDGGLLIDDNRDFEFTVLPTIVLRRDKPDFAIAVSWLCFYVVIEFLG